MIAGAALAAWLADRGAQQRSYDAVDAAALTWGHHPLMTGLETRLAALPERNNAAVLGAARSFLDNEDDIAALLAAMIAGSRADPFFRPPLHPLSSDAQTGLLLFHHRDLSISLGISGVDMLAAKKAGARGPASIGFPGVAGLFRFVKGGGATLSFWEAPAIGHDFVAAQAGQCRFVSRRTIADGEEIVLDGRRESFVIEHATSDILYFHAMVRPEAAPLSAEYDNKTL